MAAFLTAWRTCQRWPLGAEIHAHPSEQQLTKAIGCWGHMNGFNCSQVAPCVHATQTYWASCLVRLGDGSADPDTEVSNNAFTASRIQLCILIDFIVRRF